MGLDKVCYNIKWKEMRLRKNGGKFVVYAHKASNILVHIPEGSSILLY